MTYFHKRMFTIIGAKAFHCPVRDGKEWVHLAMVVKHNWLRSSARPRGTWYWIANLEEAHCVCIQRRAAL